MHLLMHPQMELKMKAICDGSKTSREVIDETVAQYRAVYLRTQQHLNVLHAVSPAQPELSELRLLIVM